MDSVDQLFSVDAPTDREASEDAHHLQQKLFSIFFY
jgi:hypothetical protein